MLPVDLHSSVGSRQEDIHSALEDYKHIDLAITEGIEPLIRWKRLLNAVGLEPLYHLFGELGKCKVWTKIRARPIDDLCLFEPSSLVLVKSFAHIVHCGNLRESDPRASHFIASLAI